MSSEAQSPKFKSPGAIGYGQAAAMVAAYAAQLVRSHALVERVELGRAPGRILARALRADRDQPPFARSTRDGFACRALEASSHMSLLIEGAAKAGDAPSGPLSPGAAWEIMTGAPLPAGADAVIMFEHVTVARGHVQLLPPRNVKQGDNVVIQGAQARAGDELLPAGTRIMAPQVALAAACGHAALEVFPRPRVAILSTGDEIVPVRSLPAPGQIRNSNAPMLAAMVVAAGGEPWILPTAPDEARALETALAGATDADLLIVTGGVSAGKFDLVEPALARMGAKFHFTGVRIQPGKPLVSGEIPRSHGATREHRGETQALPFFGLPGNPVSSAVTFILFAAPMVASLSGSREPGPRFALARMAAQDGHHGKPGLTRFLPAHCDFGAATEHLPEVKLVPWEGSGDLAAMARSNCFLVVPEDTDSLQAGAIVKILLP